MLNFIENFPRLLRYLYAISLQFRKVHCLIFIPVWNQLFTSEIKPTWSWNISLFILCSVCFAIILLKDFCICICERDCPVLVLSLSVGFHVHVTLAPKHFGISSWIFNRHLKFNISIKKFWSFSLLFPNLLFHHLSHFSKWQLYISNCSDQNLEVSLLFYIPYLTSCLYC